MKPAVWRECVFGVRGLDTALDRTSPSPGKQADFPVTTLASIQSAARSAHSTGSPLQGCAFSHIPHVLDSLDGECCFPFTAESGREGVVSELTLILGRIENGDARAGEELLPLVYAELRRLAAVKMADQPKGHTLQATALVHEAYLRLVGSERNEWENSRHFFAAAAEAMRHILVDAARRKARQKRGGSWQRLALDDLELAAEAKPESLLALHEALEEFARVDADKAELVKLRFFGGLTLPQTATALGISLATAKRHWAYARAWLYRAITESPTE